MPSIYLGIINNIKLFKLISGYHFYAFLCLYLITLFLEMIGLTMAYPVVASAIDNNLSNDHLSPISIPFFDLDVNISIGAYTQLVVFLSIFLFIVILRFFLTTYQLFLGRKIAAIIAQRILEKVLISDYERMLSIDQGRVLSAVSPKIQDWVAGVLLPLLQASGSFIVAMGVCLYLIKSMDDDFYVLIICLILFYVWYSIFIRSWAIRINQEIISSQTDFSNIITDCFRSFREIKIFGLSDSVRLRFNGIYRRFQNGVFNITLTQVSPRFILEGLFYLGLLLSVVIFYESSAFKFESVFVVMFAGIRFIPYAQNVFSGVISLFSSAVISTELANLCFDGRKGDETQNGANHPVRLMRSIELKNVQFSYRNAGCNSTILEVDWMVVKKGSWIGVIGESGSGKSTLLNILGALLFPTKGELLVDDRSVNSTNVSEWWAAIAFVGQDVSIGEGCWQDSVKLGNKTAGADFVRSCATAAGFEEEELNRLGTTSARGDGLSRGQKARLMIAAALCSEPDVLMLDEANASIPDELFNIILQNIRILRPDITLISVFHHGNQANLMDEMYSVSQGIVSKVK